MIGELERQTRFNNRVWNSLAVLIKEEPVFCIAFVLALLSSIFAHPKLEYIDFEVLACLFMLMVVVKAFEELRLLDHWAVSILNRCTNHQRVSLVMILLSFFSAMAITNDIALITLVPLTLIIGRKSNMNVMLTVILQTLAANIGSALTPIGNPQNLYIFSHYGLTAAQFFSAVCFFAVLGFIWLYALNLKTPRLNITVSFEPVPLKNKGEIALWAILFILIVLSIFNMINYTGVLILTLVITALVNKKLFLKVDYYLLATFISFFIFIGNLSNIPSIAQLVKGYLSGPEQTYFSSLILSQLISNVPCAVFLSNFTNCWRELLLGVNIGGMGTLIASLASVISYKIYVKERPQDGRSYFVQFTLYNVLSLGIFAVFSYIYLFMS